MALVLVCIAINTCYLTVYEAQSYHCTDPSQTSAPESLVPAMLTDSENILSIMSHASIALQDTRQLGIKAAAISGDSG